MNRNGLTLVELILMIAVLGVLGVAVLPRIVDTSSSVKKNELAAVEGAVGAGLKAYYAAKFAESGTGSYPSVLDNVAENTDCGESSKCFSTVLPGGVSDSDWHKVSDTVYRFDGKHDCAYHADGDRPGTFECLRAGL